MGQTRLKDIERLLATVTKERDHALELLTEEAREHRRTLRERDTARMNIARIKSALASIENFLR